MKRETLYATACQYSHTVVASSQWIKDDLIKYYNLYPSRIQVIPLAPMTAPYASPTPADLQDVQHLYHLNTPFMLNSAVTWPHKNHLRLLEALALVRDRDGLRLNLVCTGHQNEHFFNEIQPSITRLGLDDQVTFLGMVPGLHLRSLYQLAQFIIVPTLFEAASSLMFEGWQEGRPVAASAVTSLPEQAGDAALLFDPTSVEAMAEAMRTMSADETLRQTLVERGTQRLGTFSWHRTAQAYRAVYRRAARQSLSEEDEQLLGWNWAIMPQPLKEASK
jgi:glycosyltransferase involved in cell wall biosynthesis